MARLRFRKAVWLSMVLAGLLLVPVVWLLLPTTQVESGTGTSGKPLVGSWTLPQPQGPGTTRILIFRDDGRMRSVDFQDSSGAKLQDISGDWRVEDSTLVIQQRTTRFAILLGNSFPEQRLPMILGTDKELRLGDPERPILYRARREIDPSIATD